MDHKFFNEKIYPFPQNFKAILKEMIFRNKKKYAIIVKNGTGVPVDLLEVSMCYELAADSCHADSCKEYANMLSDDNGIPINKKKV